MNGFFIPLVVYLSFVTVPSDCSTLFAENPIPGGAGARLFVSNKMEMVVQEIERKRAVIAKIRVAAIDSPMQELIACLIEEKNSNVLWDKKHWAFISWKLSKLPLAQLDEMLSKGVTDFDLHRSGVTKLRTIFGNEVTLRLMRRAGMRAIQRLGEIESGLSSSEPKRWMREAGASIAKFFGSSGGTQPPVTIQALYVEARAQAIAILKGNSSTAKRELVSMVNEVTLRFALGPAEATRLLLTRGISILIHNFPASTRLVRTFEDQLLMPLNALRDVARSFRATKLMDIVIYRPQHAAEIEFLVGNASGKELMKRFPHEYAKSLTNVGFPADSPPYTDIWRILEANVNSHHEKFWIISLSNQDRLEALVGADNTDWLLKTRAEMILRRLNVDMKQAGRNVVGVAKTVIGNLSRYAHLFTVDKMMELAFFVGMGPADILTKKGILSSKKVESGFKDRKPQITTALDLIDPPRTFLDPMMEEAIRAECASAGGDPFAPVRV
jgi:hypothetical protein